MDKEILTGPRPLTLDDIKFGGINKEVYKPNHVYAVLDQAEYGDLGWKNDPGVRIPNCNWECCYSNYTGSTTIYVNHSLMIYYSVDMGD